MSVYSSLSTKIFMQRYSYQNYCSYRVMPTHIFSLACFYTVQIIQKYHGNILKLCLSPINSTYISLLVHLTQRLKLFRIKFVHCLQPKTLLTFLTFMLSRTTEPTKSKLSTKHLQVMRVQTEQMNGFVLFSKNIDIYRYVNIMWIQILR